MADMADVDKSSYHHVFRDCDSYTLNRVKTVLIYDSDSVRRSNVGALPGIVVVLTTQWLRQASYRFSENLKCGDKMM